jgi:hypothetical protein
MPTTLQQPTIEKLNSFAASLAGGKDSQAYQALSEALINSPELASSINKGILSGDINGFAPTSQPGIGGQFDPTTKYIQIPINSSTGKLADGISFGTMVFVMGHEMQHSYNAPSVWAAYNRFTNEVDNLAKNDLVQDYTLQLLAIQKVHANDEATAQIAGWNAVVSQVNAVPGNHVYGEYRYAAQAYSDFFLTPTGAALPGLAFNSDFSLGYSESNITAEGELFFYNPNVKIGFSDYPNYYGSQELSYIASAEGYAEISLDMNALRFDAFIIKNYNLLGLASGQSFKITDLHSLVGYTFDNTGKGQILEIEKPVAVPDGKATETLTFDESNVLVQTEHDWKKDDGSQGHDSADNLGNKDGSSVDVTGTAHWFFRYVSGTYGDGYRSTTENFSEVYNSDGTFNKSYYNATTGANSISYKKLDGSFGASERNSDGSSWSEYTSANGFYSKNDTGSDGSIHTYSKDAGGYYSETYTRIDGSSSSESWTSSHYYSLNIRNSDSSTSSKSITPDGSIFLSHKYEDGSYDRSYTLANGETGSTNGDGQGNEDSYLHLADDTDAHTWKKEDGSSGSEHTDKDGTLTEHFYDPDHSEHTDVYEEDGDYSEMTMHDDGTFESIKYDAASTHISYETYDLEKTRHNWGHSTISPDEEHDDLVTLADGSWVAEVISANGDYQYSTFDKQGNFDSSYRSTLNLYLPDGEWAQTVIDEGVQHSDKIGVISLELEQTIHQASSDGKTEDYVKHISQVRTDSAGFDETTTEISYNGVEVVGIPQTEHHFYQ